MDNKKYGFTLVEILITMTVIGIVASLTVPQLMNNYQRKTYTTLLKKTHSDIEQAFTRYLSDNNVNSLNLTNFADNPQNFFDNYIKMNKTSSSATYTNSFAESYKTIEGDAADFTSATCGNDGKYFLTKSGASFCVPKVCRAGDCMIFMDINGKTGPNVLGRDLFGGYIWSDGSIDVVPPAAREMLSASDLDAYRITGINPLKYNVTEEDLEIALKQIYEVLDKDEQRQKYAYLGKEVENFFITITEYNSYKDDNEKIEFLKQLYAQNPVQEQPAQPAYDPYGVEPAAVAAQAVDEEEYIKETMEYINTLNKNAELTNAINDYDEINNYYNTKDRYDEIKNARYSTCRGAQELSKADVACLGAIISDEWEMKY